MVRRDGRAVHVGRPLAAGPRKLQKPQIRLFDYSSAQVQEKEITDPAEIRGYLDSESVTWIDVQGLGDEQVLNQLATIFELHPLALEDVLTAQQRPKTETYEKQQMVLTRLVMMEDHHLRSEQVSMFIGPNYVLTFQETYGDCLDPLRERIRRAKGQVRKMGADYLAYAILDSIIDGYYPVLEHYQDELNDLEEQVVTQATPTTLAKLRHVIRDLLSLRQGLWPERDAINVLIRDESPLLTPAVRVYMRNCYDHVVGLVDMLETYHQLSLGLMEVYVSSVSNRLNEVMKVLTIIATIFMPLSFLASVYGMNFHTTSPWNMPELTWQFGYLFFWMLCLLLAGGMLIYFKRRRWM